MAVTVPTALTLYSVHVLALARIVLADAPISLSAASGADAAPINCARVITICVAPCIPYLTNPGGALLTPSCCNGIRTLVGAAWSAADSQTVCRCLKSAAESFPGINYDFASPLPTRCRIKTTYSFSPSTDCNSVK